MNVTRTALVEEPLDVRADHLGAVAAEEIHDERTPEISRRARVQRPDDLIGFYRRELSCDADLNLVDAARIIDRKSVV